MTCSIEGCENYCEGRTDKCASCNHAARKAAKEAFKPVKVYKIKKVSSKLAPELRKYTVNNREYLEEHPLCEVRLVGCENVATSVHHTKKRGKNINNVESFKSACNWCHHQIEFVLSAKERREMGLLNT